MAQIRGERFEVGLSAAEIGPALSIALSEPTASTYRWELFVDVGTREGGRARLGYVRTIGPATFGTPRACNRIVAIAYCPGAVHWYVHGHALQPIAAGPSPREAVADITIASDRCGIATPGVHIVSSEQTTPHETFALQTRSLTIAPNDRVVLEHAPNVRARMLANEEPNGGRVLRVLGTFEDAGGFAVFAHTSVSLPSTRLTLLNPHDAEIHCSVFEELA